MPNIKSAKKRMKTSEKSRMKNQSVKSRITTERTKLYKAILAGDKAGSEKMFRVYCSVLDKAVKNNVIKSNAAGRRKSRASARMAAMS